MRVSPFSPRGEGARRADEGAAKPVSKYVPAMTTLASSRPCSECWKRRRVWPSHPPAGTLVTSLYRWGE
ncbi:hypothetical protein REMIM1_CH03124 [Rhizobium etli bv. mimosae str. Mim1]|nr:hypothetical protein REMIM1_CH03124 [Rhizobium etli bv. mimosae str. Mim1]